MHVHTAERHCQVEEGPSEGYHAQQQSHLSLTAAVGVQTERQRVPGLCHSGNKNNHLLVYVI